MRSIYSISVGRNDERRRRSSDAHERNLLDIGAVGITRLEADLPKLSLHVCDGFLLAGTARLAAFELIGGKGLDFAEERIGGDGVPRGLKTGLRTL